MLLHEHFVRNAKRFHAKPAFIDRGAGKRFTYRKTLLSSLLLAAKIRPIKGKYIGIMLPTGAGCAFSILASLMAGKTPVMINYSTGAAENASYAKKKCGFETIITSRAFLEKIGCSPSACPPLALLPLDKMLFLEDLIKGVTLWEKLRAFLVAKLPLNAILKRARAGTEDEHAVILFTSGSEKEPKCVPLTHENILANIEAFGKVINFSEKDAILATLPYFHVFGLTATLWTPLYFGMTIVTYPNPLDYKTVCSVVREEKPTVIVGTPSFYRGYLKKSEPGDFKSVRIAVSGADKCPDSVRGEFLEKHGITLLEGYGATETSPVISVNTPERNKPGSVGKVLPNIQVKVQDCETGLLCETGRPGKVLVKGPSVMKGYLEDPLQTETCLKGGWYDTGDMGWVDEDGFLWHAGRLKRFTKIGGEMISLLKVESVLEEFLPTESSCCVIEVPDSVKEVKLIAVVTSRVNEKALLKQLSAHLPNLALPKEFVYMEELPRMGSGKVDFRRVGEMVRGK